MLFLSVRGFLDYAGPSNPLAIGVVAVLPSSTRNGVGVLFHRLFEAQSPRPPIPLSTLQAASRDVACKTRGQDGFATLLSRRALSSPTTCRFIPALSGLPVIRPQSSRRATGFPTSHNGISGVSCDDCTHLVLQHVLI